MITDELFRAVRALVACRGWSQDEALEHLLRLPEERRGRISASLKAWAIEPMDGDPAPVSLDDSLAMQLRGVSPQDETAREPARPRESVTAQAVAEPVA